MAAGSELSIFVPTVRRNPKGAVANPRNALNIRFGMIVVRSQKRIEIKSLRRARIFAGIDPQHIVLVTGNDEQRVAYRHRR
jgi:hypothetical protein